MLHADRVFTSAKQSKCMLVFTSLFWRKVTVTIASL